MNLYMSLVPKSVSPFNVLLLLSLLFSNQISSQCVDYNDVLENIFSVSCFGGCHNNGAGGLFLTYDELVNQVSNCNEMPYLISGDPAGSYLVDKINQDGSQACGSSMPLGGTLDAADIALVMEWIEKGALEESVLGCTDPNDPNFEPTANCDDGSCSTLPIYLASFEAQNMVYGNVLKWSIYNNSFFKDMVLEKRSGNNEEFETLFVVPYNVSDESVIDFEYTDNELFDDLNYYRLVEVTETGQRIEASKTIAVEASIDYTTQIKLSPNPVTESMLIQFSTEGPSVFEIVIYSLQGKRMLYSENTSSDNYIFEYVDVTELENGSYILEVKIDNKTFIKKFMKL